jgi:release factor glutamine methyltransferase
MNANSKQPALQPTINDWISRATASLEEAGIPSGRLDAELMLAHVLQQSRTWLLAHSLDTFDDAEQRHAANTLLTKRKNRFPLAYLTGTKEFYGRDFIVTPDVLIPRPETETMIELLVKYKPHGAAIDVGCGSGCIGITATLEYPDLAVTLADISPAALTVAQQNAVRLGADVDVLRSNLLESIGAKTFDVILANLPYVDRAWERSPETEHEPALALFAGENGLELITILLGQAVDALNPEGYVFLEADPEQHDEIKKTGASHGLRFVEAEGFIVVLQRG